MKQRINLPEILRKYILSRDNYNCKHCNKKGYDGLEIHHIDHNPMNNDETNLITLCTHCHDLTKTNKFPHHGYDRITGGNIKGLTDTDYFHIICPVCKKYWMSLYPQELRKDNVLLIGIKCNNCDFKDLIKIHFEEFDLKKVIKYNI